MPPYTLRELRVLRRLREPHLVQRFLDDEIAYNKEPGGATCRSPRGVMRDRTAHCMEGALFAAAAMAVHGHRPLLVDLEAERDSDHVLAVFRRGGGWGAVAKSNFAGLRYREPVYRTIRELVMSYFEHYYNLRGERSLRRHSRPVSLGRFPGWETSENQVWEIPSHLVQVRHYPVVSLRQRVALTRMDRRLFEAGQWGSVK